MKAVLQKLKSSANYTTSKGEENHQASQTVPDQSLTVKEILQRYASGTMPDIHITQHYNEDNVDLRGLDYVQLNEMAQQNKAEIDEIQKRISDDSKRKQEQAEALNASKVNDLMQEIEQLKKQIK